jgi:hypothetical protein
MMQHDPTSDFSVDNHTGIRYGRSMTTTPKSEYGELKEAGMTDHEIRMARNTGASHKAILLWAKRVRRADETVCEHCGVTTTTWSEWRRGEMVTRSRDYHPVSFMIRLKPDTKSTYIVEPELERFLKSQPFSRIRSTDEGKLEYAIDASRPSDLTIGRLLDIDGRIEEWHTETSAPVCDRHVNFVFMRWSPTPESDSTTHGNPKLDKLNPCLTDLD